MNEIQFGILALGKVVGTPFAVGGRYMCLFSVNKHIFGCMRSTSKPGQRGVERMEAVES